MFTTGLQIDNCSNARPVSSEQYVHIIINTPISMWHPGNTIQQEISTMCSKKTYPFTITVTFSTVINWFLKLHSDCRHKERANTVTKTYAYWEQKQRKTYFWKLSIIPCLSTAWVFGLAIARILLVILQKTTNIIISNLLLPK